MRRRRLPGRRRATSLVARAHSSDLRYLERVVTIQYPIRAARTFLQRTMGNAISYKLVEARRGETVGMVRAVEIEHANGGRKTWISGERVLANGEPASFFVPDHLVEVKARIDGEAKASRSLSHEDRIVLHVAVRGYLRYLPAIFQGEGPVSSRELTRITDASQRRWGHAPPEESAIETVVDADPMRRFLFLFQHMMTTVTERIDNIVHLTDPLLCDAKFLPWLASWVSFDLDEALPVHQQRELVRRAIRLYRTRGTRPGIEEMIRVLTSAPVRIRERVRPPPAVLGKNIIVGGRNVVDRYRREEPIGVYLVEPDERSSTSYFTLVLEPRDRFHNRFGERAATVLRRIVHVVSQERPSHIAFAVQFDERR